MKAWLALSMVLCLTTITACDREQRRFSEPPPVSTPTPAPSAQVVLSELRPGGGPPEGDVRNPYEESAYAVSEGQRLYNQFNCVGCHSHGGGGMGPPLMDDEWIYGSAPENVAATIIEGRPNGMPAFRGRIANQQLWQLVAYVRSMSGLTAKTTRPTRDEHMAVATPPSQAKPERPTMGTGTRSMPPASTQP